MQQVSQILDLILTFDLCGLQILQKGGPRLLSSPNPSLTMSPATTRTSHAVRRSLSSVSQANRQKRLASIKRQFCVDNPGIIWSIEVSVLLDHTSVASFSEQICPYQCKGSVEQVRFVQP